MSFFKLLSIIILLFICNWQGECQINQNTVNDLKGIKSIKEHTVYSADEKGYETNKLNRDSIFSNNIGLYTLYDTEGNPKIRNRYFPYRDSNGQLVTWRARKDKIEWIYNSKNLEFKHIKYIEDNSIHSFSISAYNDEDFLIKKELYSGNKKIIIYTYKYNEKGNLTTKIENSLIRNRLTTTKYSYDEKSNVKEEIFYNTDSNIIEVSEEDLSNKIQYEYNKRGDLILETKYTGDNIDYKKRIKYVYGDNDRIESKIHFTTTGYNSDESIEVIEYKYDNKNNWITRLRKVDKIIKTVTEREIEYY